MAQSSLTLLSEVVAEGAVSSLDTGTITISQGKVYHLEFQIITDSTAADRLYRMYFNGDTTGSNYRRSVIQSSGYADSTNNPLLFGPRGAVAQAYGFISIEDSYPSIMVTELLSREALGVSYGTLYGDWSATETTLTQVQLDADIANSITAGSYLRIWEGIQST